MLLEAKCSISTANCWLGHDYRLVSVGRGAKRRRTVDMVGEQRVKVEREMGWMKPKGVLAQECQL